jgi:flagellar biosynthetic protein FlhB
MADNNQGQDRTLPATPRRLEKAREEGQVARSRDFSHFGAIAAGGAVLVAAAPRVFAWLREAVAGQLTFDRAAIGEPGVMMERLASMAFAGLLLVVPLGALMIAVAVLGSSLIGGWNWSFKPLAPKFSKLNPITGLPRMFAKQQLVDALKACLLALVLGTIAGFYLKSHFDAFGGLMALPLPAALQSAGQTVVAGLAFVVLALALFALVDAPLQRHLLAERLKMSHQEVKQEHKELEGNAEIKSKIRVRMREMSRRRMMAAVPNADLVVMNPTHYAVALKYDDATMAAPRVVAKGADLLAMAIRDAAQGAKVPVLQAPVLARALYAHAELDREIPAALFAAVAQVLAYVYQLRAALAGRSAMPGELPALNVPQELDPHFVKAGEE